MRKHNTMCENNQKIYEVQKIYQKIYEIQKIQEIYSSIQNYI